jgi:hypothetical protein
LEKPRLKLHAQVLTPYTVREEPGLQVTVRGKPEPLRAKMTKLAGHGRLRKRGDGRFTARSW